MSTKYRLAEEAFINIQEAIASEESKDTPTFVNEDLTNTLQGTEAEHLRIHVISGEIYSTDGSNERGVVGVGFYRYDEDRGGCCQLGRREKYDLSNRLELGALHDIQH